MLWAWPPHAVPLHTELLALSRPYGLLVRGKQEMKAPGFA